MKRIFIIAITSLWLQAVHAQQPFHKLIDTGHPISRFMSVLPTDSCYYVIGTSTDSLSTVGALWCKISLTGDLLAVNTISHPDRYYFNDFGDIRSTPQGHLYIAGSLNDIDFSTQVNFYLYDQSGDTLLTKQYRSINYPDKDFVVPINILQRSEGGFAIVCVHDSDENDISLLLIDSTYQIEEYFSYGTSSRHEKPGSLLIDDDGYIIGAERTNAGQVLVDYDNRTYILKVDDDGEVAWEYLSPAGVLRDEAKAMIKTPDGGLVVASGIGQEIGNNPNIHTLVWDALIFKLDADQNIVWSTPFRGDLPTGSTELTEMVEAPDGSGYVASGIFLEYPHPDTFHHTSWLVKVSSEGDSLWTRRFTYFDGEFVAPEAFDMKATPDGGYVLVGYSQNLGLPAPGWIMKVDEHGCLIPDCHLNDDTTSVARDLEKRVELAIYPNPASDFLNFQLRGERPAKGGSFRIVGTAGEVLAEIKGAKTGNTFTVPVHGWPDGTYFLQYIENGEVRAVEKFVKQ